MLPVFPYTASLGCPAMTSLQPPGLRLLPNNPVGFPREGQLWVGSQGYGGQWGLLSLQTKTFLG